MQALKRFAVANEAGIDAQAVRELRAADTI